MSDIDTVQLCDFVKAGGTIHVQNDDEFIRVMEILEQNGFTIVFDFRSEACTGLRYIGFGIFRKPTIHASSRLSVNMLGKEGLLRELCEFMCECIPDTYEVAPIESMFE